jgi:hypothetical protein
MGTWWFLEGIFEEESEGEFCRDVWESRPESFKGFEQSEAFS